MKKIFLFFSAALVATSLCATPIKQSIDLSAVEEYGTVTWNAVTKTIQTDNEHDWAGVHTNATLDATGYSKLVLVLKEGYETVNVNLHVNYTDATSQNKTNVAGLKTICIPLNGTDISDIIIRVTNYSSSAVLDELYLYKVIGKEEEVNLFEGSHVFGSSWENWLPLNDHLSKYSSLHEGDKVVINYTGKVEGSAFQVRICGTNHQLSQAGDYVDISHASQAEFELCEEDIAALKVNGMYLNGENLTITKVSLLTYAQQIMVEKVLNTGNESLGTDWGQHWLHTTDLPTLAAGDELRVTVSEAGETDLHIWICYDWTEANHIKLENVKTVTTTVPQVYSVALTEEQATAINTAHQLFIKGYNATLSHFAIVQPMSIYDENLLWYGEEAAGDSWTNVKELSADKFSGVEVGDVLYVQLTDLESDGKVFFTQGNYTAFTVKPNFYFNSSCAAPMALSFVINESMKNELQTNGLVISGQKFTMSAVYIVKATAHTESYTLKVSDAGMATLVLPFNATLPAGVEAYRLTNDGSNAIEATAVSAIQADKPVLIIAAANDDPGYEFVSEEGADTCIFYKSTWSVGTYQDGNLHGNYASSFIVQVPEPEHSTYNYVLQNIAGVVGFYQVMNYNDATISPYRAFLSCGYNANPGGVSSAPMRIVFRQQTPTDAEALTAEGQQPTAEKVLLDGKLFIIRNGVMYNVNGQIIQ